MKFITLTTDYDLRDFYLAKVKSRLYRAFPDHYLLDLHHHVNLQHPNEKHNLKNTAYSFNAMLGELDELCINLIFVFSHYSPDYFYVVAKTKSHGYIIAPNNGILGLIDTEYLSFKKLNVAHDSFPELDVIKQLKALNLDFEQLEVLENPYLSRVLPAKIVGEKLRGEIIYIDGYHNCITNITKQAFEEFTQQQGYEIEIRSQKVLSISENYSQVREGGFAVFFNSQNLLEISFIQDSAKNLLGLKMASTINIKKV
jgi:S-adenosylmethionine hydrolase